MPDIAHEVLAYMAESVAIYDLEARVVYVNPATERLFGKPLAELVGHPLWELFPDAIGNDFHREFERVRTGKVEATSFDNFYAPFAKCFANRITRVGNRIHVVSSDVTADRRRGRRIEATGRISAILAAEDLDLAQATAAIADILTEIVSADCSIALLTADRAWLELVAMSHTDPTSRAITKPVSRFPSTTGHPGVALAKRETVLANRDSLRAHAADVAERELREVVERYQPASLIVAPLLAGDDAIGVLMIVRREDPTLTDEDRVLAAEIAPSIGLYIAHARRRAEATSLRERLSAVADSNPALVSLLDTERRYLYVNRAYERWYGVPREQLVGRRIEDTLGPEPYAIVKPFIDRALAGEEVHYQTPFSYSGGARHIDATYVPIRGPTGVEGFAAIVRDISAEVRVQRVRELVTEASAIPSRSLELEETLRHVIRLPPVHFAEWVGLDLIGEDDRLERIEQTRKELAHFEGPRRIAHSPQFEGASRAIANNEAILLRDIDDAVLQRIARDDQHLAYLRLVAPRSSLSLPLLVGDRTLGAISLASRTQNFDPDDVPVFTEFAYRAATAIENARLYYAAQQARSEAEAADRAKDQFLAMLGHELRNPLAPITTALHLMKMRHPNVAERERAVIERQVTHLTRLVDDLLDVSRITRGKIVLQRQRVPLGDVIARSIEIASPLFEQRRHRLALDVPQELYVEGDPTRLDQVVANLLSNAAKYTDNGGQISVTAWRDGDLAVLTVADNGVGIAPDVLPKVFDVFVQAPQESAREVGGLGLGLAIVKSIVELHGGTVVARSAGHGRGSELEVRLPLARERSGERRPSQPPITRTTGRRILVVDDNRDAAAMLSEVLDSYGYSICTAYDGPSALKLVDELAPEIAILDIGLPVMDGYELAERLRDRTPPIRLIAVTGYGQVSDRERALAAGFVAHVPKPVSIPALIELIETT